MPTHRHEQKPRGAAGSKALAAKGGCARSKAKLLAIRRLHAKRRGVRVHPDLRDRESVLAELHTAVRKPMRGFVSIRQAALACAVSDRTVRRWLTGEDWPPALALKRLDLWLHRVTRRGTR